MALQLALSANDSPIGVAFATAYFRILDFHSDIGSESEIRFTVGTYSSQTERQAGKEPVRKKLYVDSTFDHTEAKNIKTKLYEYLKTLNEYTGAVDV